VLSLGGQYGAGASAASSVADDVLWVVSPVNTVALVNLSTDKVVQVSATGLPSNGILTLAAESAASAVATYSGTTCAGGKTNCSPRTGMLATTDGGQTWSGVADVLAS
jgi:hypothetical protein